MKILVTGGAGFIGSNFIRMMIKKYSKDIFVCLDSLTYAGNILNMADFSQRKNFIFIKGDIRDKEFINRLFKKENFDIVVNFAAETHVDRSFDYPELFYETNYIGTKNLLDASINNSVKHFHQVSTDEVYGPSTIDEFSRGFKEDAELNPTNPYSKSKADADLLTLEYYKKYGLFVTISRSSNNFGPYQFPEKLIPLAIDCLLADKKVPIYGNGKNLRNWIYVVDHCSAIEKIIKKGKPGEIFNIASTTTITNIDIIKLIIDILKKPADSIYFTKDRNVNDYSYILDYSKIKNELKWRESSSFIKNLKNTIKWYTKNVDWLSSIKSKESIEWETKHYSK